MNYIFSRPEIPAILMGCIIPMAIAFAIYWAKAKKHQDDNEPK